MVFDIVTPRRFNYYLKKSKRIEFVTVYPEKVLKSKILLLAKIKEGGAGSGLMLDGKLFNLFNNTDIKGLGGAMVECAIALGACKLSCFDGFLARYYEGFGFHVVKKIPWNPGFAPVNWDYLTYGRPNVVYMER